MTESMNLRKQIGPGAEADGGHMIKDYRHLSEGEHAGFAFDAKKARGDAKMNNKYLYDHRVIDGTGGSDDEDDLRYFRERGAGNVGTGAKYDRRVHEQLDKRKEKGGWIPGDGYVMNEVGQRVMLGATDGRFDLGPESARNLGIKHFTGANEPRGGALSSGGS